MKKFILNTFFCFGVILFDCYGDSLSFIKNAVAEAMQFPSEQLIIVNYLSEEKKAYSSPIQRELHRENFGDPLIPKDWKPLINTDYLYEACLVTGVNVLSFHPIVITVAKRNTYSYPKVQEIIEVLNGLPELPMSQKGRLPFGNFQLEGAINAELFIEEVRHPSTPLSGRETELGEKIYYPVPDFTLGTRGPTPETSPSIVSLVQVANSDVDIRIAKYDGFYSSDNLVKIPGGEQYYEMFHEEEDDYFPIGSPRKAGLQVLFRKLNMNIITSPVIAKYITKPSQDSKVENSQKIAPAIQNVPQSSGPSDAITEPPAPNETPIQNDFWLIGLGVLVILLTLSWFIFKRLDRTK